MGVREILLFSSSFTIFLACVVYVVAILRGEAKPHRTTRLVLLLITTLATFSLLAQNNQVAIWLIGASFFMSLIIFLLSIKFGMGGWSKIDVLCLLIAFVGILTLRFTNNPVLALYSAILADFTGIVPTIIKIYFYPETEIWTFYFLGALAAAFNLGAIKSWTLEEFSYPLYLVILNIFLIGLVLRGRLGRRFKSS